MKRITAILNLALSLLASTSTGALAQGRAQTSEQVSVALYPQTQSWITVASTPTVSSNDLSLLRDQLTNAYQASKPILLNGPDCSFIDRSFEKEQLDQFHWLDIDHDGNMDVVYTGSAQCAEGNATVVWFGGKAGFHLGQVPVWPLLLLRVSQASDQISTAELGCCGAPTDAFYIGSLTAPRSGERTINYTNTVVPRSTSQKGRFSAPAELSLRSAPAIDNAYSEQLSEVAGRAVIGNVVRTYLPKSSGEVLATQMVAGDSWCFVRVDKGYDVRAVHDPYLGARVGWVKANELRWRAK